MSLAICEVEKAVSPAGSGYWVQVHDFTPENTEEKKLRGRLVAILGVRGDAEGETMQMVELGREVLSRLHELYFGDLAGGVLDRLKISMEKLEEEFENKVEVAAAVDMEKTLYVSTNGGARVFAKTEEAMGLVGGEIKTTTRAFSMIKVKKITLILGTGNFWEKFGEGRIKAIVESDRSAVEMAEEMAVMVGSEEVGGGVGGVIVKIDETPEEEINEVIPAREPDGHLIIAERWKTGMFNFWGQTRKKFDNDRVAFGSGGGARWGGVVLAILAALIIGGGIWRQVKGSNQATTNNKLVEVEQKLAEIKMLVDYNPTRATEMLLEIQKDIDNLGKVRGEKAKNLVTEAGQLKEQAAGIVRTNFTEIFDLSLLREGLKAEKMKKAEGNILILDATSGRVVNFLTDKEKGDVVLGGTDTAGVNSLTYYPGLLYLAGSGGIKECSLESWKCTLAVQGTEVPAGITDAAVWTGNLYVLDGQEGKIWKYQKTGASFGKKISWMDTDPALVGAGSMGIDGQIWVSLVGGGVGKYNRGQKEDFTIPGEAALGIGKAAVMNTSDDEQKLYILDTENGRIVIVDKNGERVKQLVSDTIKQATAIVVYEDKGKLYLAAGSKIYKTDLP